MSDSVQPHKWQPTRLLHPWDSRGKNTRVGCLLTGSHLILNTLKKIYLCIFFFTHILCVQCHILHLHVDYFTVSCDYSKFFNCLSFDLCTNLFKCLNLFKCFHYIFPFTRGIPPSYNFLLQPFLFYLKKIRQHFL